MEPNYLVLLGIVIVIIGFALKLDAILIIIVSAVATALVGGIIPKRATSRSASSCSAWA